MRGPFAMVGGKTGLRLFQAKAQRLHSLSRRAMDRRKAEAAVREAFE